MTDQTAPSQRLRVVSHERPLHLRSLSHPISRGEADRISARQQVADAFQRHCA